MKNILFTLLALSFSAQIYTQQLDIQWGPKITYDSKTVGFYDGTIGSNDSYIFSFWTDGAEWENKVKKQKIVAINKETLKITKEYPLKGFEGSILEQEAFKGWTYSFAEVFADKIVLFCYLKEKDREKIGAILLDHNLKQLSSLKVIHEGIVDTKEETGTSSIVIADARYSDKIIILNENPGAEKNVLVKYKSFNTDLELTDMNQFDLPFEWTKNKYDLTPKNNYDLAEGDHIFIATNTKEQIGGTEKRPKYKYFATFTVVDLNTAAYKSYALVEEDVEFSGSKFRVLYNKAIIEGFYKDMSIEENDQKINGIFHLEMDVNSGTVSEIKKIPFEKAFYENFKADEIPSSARRAKKADERAKNLVDQMSFEQILVNPEETIMICSLLENGSTTTCDGKGNCRTTYWCIKRAVIAFTIDNSMNMVNYSVIPRLAKYGGWNVKDVFAAALENNRHVITFGSNFSVNEVAASGRKEVKVKKKDELKSNWEYAILNSDGVLEKKSLIINQPNTKDEDLVTITPGSIKVIDGVPYIFSNVRQRKAGRMCLSMLTCYLVHPFAGSAFKGQFRLGKLIEK